MMQQRPLTMDDIQDKIGEYKETFAKYLARGIDPMRAALGIFGNANVGLVYQCGQEWPVDPYVMETMDRLTGGSSRDVELPSKEQLAKMIMKDTKAAFVFEDKLKGYKLYADVMGHIDKGASVVNNNIIDNRRVMVKVDHGSDEDWERKAVEQQRKLIDVAATDRSTRSVEPDTR